MQLPITGPAYEHSTSRSNMQRCINMYPAQAGQDGQGNPQWVLLPTAGLKTMVTISGNQVRSIMEFDGTVYAVVDDGVYKLTINDNTNTATAAQIGSLTTSGAGRILWARNSTQIFFTDSTATGGYILTVATDTVTQIADADFTGAETVVFLDSYFIYNTPNGTTMFSTASNDGSSINAIDVATAEGNPDKLIALAVDKRELYALGTRSVEVWYNAANPSGFPFSRRPGAWVDLGCGARQSVLNINNSLMWLDHRGYVVAKQGYTPVVVSSEAINQQIQAYSRFDDAYAIELQERGHLFYVITFPTAKKTWVYDITTQQWHERAYWNQDQEFEHYRGFCSTNYGHRKLVGDRASGKIFISDDSTFTEDSSLVHRVRSTQYLENDFKRLSVNSFELQLDPGLATPIGDGSDPMVQLRYSVDGGHSWSHSMARSMGKIGEYSKGIRWNRLGLAEEWLFEIRIAEPINFAIIDASINIKVGY